MDSRNVLSDRDMIAAGDRDGWRGVADAVYTRMAADHPSPDENPTVWALGRLTAQVTRLADAASKDRG